MKYQLREYQRSAIENVKNVLTRNPILVAPTGSGKTFMGVSLIKDLSLPTLWLAHRKELIEQAAAQLEEFGLYVGVIKSGVQADSIAPVQVASVQTLIRRKKPDAGLIVIDECHRTPSQTYQTILDDYTDVPVMGLTATPFRLDGCGLGCTFGEIVVAATTAELCDAGYLHRPKVFASKSPDLNGVKITMGDYNISELGKRANDTQLTADIVKTWQLRANGLKTVCFAVNIEHSKTICTAFQSVGVRAEHIDGKTPADDRAAVLRRLETGETQVVSNCMILTEGWDMPSLQCAIIARPTASLNLHLQTIGRVMRSCPGKDGAIVLDHAGNHHRHGLVTRQLEYTLDDTGTVGSSEPLGLRRCGQCGLFFDTYKYACPECEWTPDPRECPKTANEELTEFDDSQHEYRAITWAAIEEERTDMEYQEGWSRRQFHERFGDWPVVAHGELVDTKHATQPQKKEVFRQLSQIGLSKGFKPGWASHQYQNTFNSWPRGFVAEVRRELGIAEESDLWQKYKT